MATAEAPIHDNIKKALVAGDENSTQLVMRSLKNTERVYKNAASDEVRRTEAPSAPTQREAPACFFFVGAAHRGGAGGESCRRGS